MYQFEYICLYTYACIHVYNQWLEKEYLQTVVKFYKHLCYVRLLQRYLKIIVSAIYMNFIYRYIRFRWAEIHAATWIAILTMYIFIFTEMCVCGGCGCVGVGVCGGCGRVCVWGGAGGKVRLVIVSYPCVGFAYCDSVDNAEKLVQPLFKLVCSGWGD